MGQFEFAKNFDEYNNKKKGASTYGDGQFQFEDVSNFIGHHTEKLGIGILGGLEGIYDGVVGGVSQILGQQDFAKKLYDDDWSARLGQNVDERYNPQGIFKKTGDWVQSAGDMLPSIAIGVGLAALTGGSSLAFSSAAQFGNVLGKSTAQAYDYTGELGFKENAYGIVSATIEMVIEMASGGIGGLGKGYVDNIAKKIIPTSFARNMIGEGLEEVASTVLDPFLQRATINKDAKNASVAEITQSFIDGALVSGILQGGQAGVNRVKTDRVGKRILENSNLSEEEQQTNNATTVMSLVEEAKKLNLVDTKSYERVIKGEKPSAHKVGKLALEVNAKKMENLIDRISKSQDVDKKEAEKMVNTWMWADQVSEISD